MRTFFAQTTVQAANGGDRPEACVIWIAETDYRNFDLKTENMDLNSEHPVLTWVFNLPPVEGLTHLTQIFNFQFSILLAYNPFDNHCFDIEVGIQNNKVCIFAGGN